jgi:hypothetical protein
VPSSLALLPPLRRDRQPGDAAALLRLRVDGGAEVTSVLTFAWPVDAAAQRPELLLAPSPPGAPGAPIGQRVRLRFEDGSLLSPVVHPLTGPGVSGEPPYRQLAVTLALPPGASRVWAVTSSDLAVSPLGGAWLLQAPAASLAGLPAPAAPAGAALPTASSSPEIA